MESIAILIVITIILVGLFSRIAQYVSHKLNMYNKSKAIPGPKAYPIIGNAHLFIGNTEDLCNTFLNLENNYELLWRLWLGTKLIVMVNNPEYIKTLLKSPNITDKSELYENMKPIASNGLLTAPATVWNPHRKLLNGYFLKRFVKSHMDVLVYHSTALAEKLEILVGEELDVFHYVICCTLDLIYDGILDTQLNSLTNKNCKLAESIEWLLDIAMQRIVKIWLHPDIIFYNTAMGKKAQTCLSYLDNITSNIIKEKKESLLNSNINRELTEKNSEQKPKTLLDVLFESSYEGEKYSEQDIRDEINTFAIAGSETIATVISFALLMIAIFPDIQDKLYEELNQIYGSNDRKHLPLRYDDIQKMKFLERVIKETLRLFPPAPIFARKVSQDIEVTKDWTIPKDSTAVFNIYNIHRNEKYWSRPLVFDPDRFLPENNSSANFFPFSYGRRNCIGQNFAMLEMTIIIATLIRKFLIKIDKPIEIAEIGVKLSITLKPTKPIRLKFERRN